MRISKKKVYLLCLIATGVWSIFNFYEIIHLHTKNRNSAALGQQSPRSESIQTFWNSQSKNLEHFNRYNATVLQHREAYYPSDVRNSTNLSQFAESLSKYSDEQGWIILIQVAGDTYVDFGVNFFLTSIDKLSIRNYLFIVYSDYVMRTCIEVGMNCFMYLKRDFSEERESNQFGGNIFKEKTTMRLFYTLDTLLLGFNVLTFDADVTLFKNPLPYFLNRTVEGKKWDFAGHGDKPWMVNIGCSLYRNTPATKQLLKCALNRTQQLQRIEQWAIADCQSDITSLVVYNELSHAGNFHRRDFWGRYGYFATNCSGCFLVHPVLCGRESTKKIVLKESLMWNADSNGYYSAKDQKYLQAAWIGVKNKKEQLAEFNAALSLASSLNRTLVAPMFSCRGKHRHFECPLYKLIGDPDRISEDKFKVYDGLREHYFLLHPLVPKSVSQSTSDVFFAQKDSSVTSDAINVLDLFKHFQISCQENKDCFKKHFNAIRSDNDVVLKLLRSKKTVLRILNPSTLRQLYIP